jgi:hypothetical protein
MYPIVSRTNEADKGQLEVLTANTILAGHSKGLHKPVVQTIDLLPDQADSVEAYTTAHPQSTNLVWNSSVSCPK